MSQSLGFVDRDSPHFVCKLRKAIYDLKQAPCAWYYELRQYLIYVAFSNSLANTSISELRVVVLVGLLLCFVKVLVFRSTSCYLCFSGQISCYFSSQISCYFLGQISC